MRWSVILFMVTLAVGTRNFVVGEDPSISETTRLVRPRVRRVRLRLSSEPADAVNPESNAQGQVSESLSPTIGSLLNDDQERPRPRQTNRRRRKRKRVGQNRPLDDYPIEYPGEYNRDYSLHDVNIEPALERPRRLRRRKYRPRYRPYSDSSYADYPTSERYYTVDSLGNSEIYAEYDGSSVRPEEIESEVNLDSGRFKDQGFTVSTSEEPLVEEISPGITETIVKFKPNIKLTDPPVTTTILLETSTPFIPEVVHSTLRPSLRTSAAPIKTKSQTGTQGIPISISELLKQKNLTFSDVLKENILKKNLSESLSKKESPKIDPVIMTGQIEEGSERRNRINLAKTNKAFEFIRQNKYSYSTTPIITSTSTTSTTTEKYEIGTRPTNKKYSTSKYNFSSSTMRISSTNPTTVTSTERTNDIELITHSPSSYSPHLIVSEKENKIIIKPIVAIKAAVMAAAGGPQNKIDSESPIHVQMAIPLEPQRKLAQLDVIESTSVKDELVDFLRTENGSARLARILASRNMTLRELIEHRERGSSQQHLADIFRTRSEEWNSEAQNEKGIPSLSEMFKNTTSTTAATTMKISTTTSTTQASTNDEKNIKLDENNYLKNNEKEPANVEYLQQLENFERHYRQQNGLQSGKIALPDLVHIEHLTTDQEGHRIFSVGEVEVVENNIEELNSLDAKKRSFQTTDDVMLERIPAAVKSAIIVSSAIFGLAILMFLTIFVTCRVRQRRARQRYAKEIMNSSSPNPIIKNTHRTRNTPIFVASASYRKDMALVEDQDFVAPRRYYLWNTIRKTLR